MGFRIFAIGFMEGPWLLVIMLCGGGDCGIRFEAGREYTFRFWAKDFLVTPYLIDC
jgi:hypothetical protein